MIKVLVPIKLTERKPLHSGRYPIKFYSGMLQAKRWIPAKNEFGRVDEALVDAWYDEVEFPSGDDLLAIAKDDIPKQTHPDRVALLLEGMKIMARHYENILKQKGG